MKFVLKRVFVKPANSYKGVGLFAGEPLLRGEKILHFKGELYDDENSNVESMQIDENLFLQSTIGIDDNINHSCDPNAFVKWDSLDVDCLKDIKNGDEITLNYDTFEYDLINMTENCSFKCNCGSKNCYKEIKSFKYLPMKEKIKLKPLLSPFILRKFKEEKK